MPSIYSADAYIVVAQRITPLELQEPQRWGPSDQLVDTEVEVLRSPLLARRVARSLRPILGEAITAEELSSQIEVARVGLTYLVKITAEAQSPQRAALLANSFAREYVAERLNELAAQPAPAQQAPAAQPGSEAAGDADLRPAHPILPNARLLALAEPPSQPIHPPRTLLLLVALLAAIAAGVLAALAAHLLRRRTASETPVPAAARDAGEAG